MGDEGLSGLLPKAPPPRPARREAAIAAAMRRFDGIADAPAEPQHMPARPPLWKSRWGQAGAFASILLVAMITVPIALETPPRTPPAPRSQAPVAERVAKADPRADSPQAPGPARPAKPPAATPDAPSAPATRGAGASPPAADTATASSETAQPEMLASRLERAPSPRLAPPAPPPPAAPPPPMAEARTDTPSIVATAGRTPRPAMEAAAPLSMAEKTEATDEGVVVTGARLPRSRAASRRGDWNACTVHDPMQRLSGCKHLVNPAAKGDAGIAAARLADGLALAWQGEWDAAVRAFDQAIALEPKRAFAYLNRGLSYQRNGELTRAAADLDLAVRHAPHAARGYYYRSLLRRQQGDIRGAEADAARAVERDPRYETVLD
ncbi:tetratricopeptide repeat protein [Sphingomonas koreensis]|uniref:tetratricopeptide repeat protein n=2 Tax=Sphingomonas koreensis TaxID=93064 RepID=UPI000837A3B9|nr:tetratricopeptide repeat protein [Sphingomonas koreensis]PJI89304.1 TPR repeat protein [Sphingomonas koreensis]